MTAYTDFHYSPTGSGVISGSQVLEQTEQGINGLGQYVQDNISGAIDTANEALTIAQTANTNATTALNTANSFSDAITTANQTANNALTTAQSAQSTANAASSLATTANNNATSALNAANAATSNVNTLTSTVNGLGNRMTAAENAINTNAGNITTLQNNLATTNANVTAAANAASSAQATATSAQATATSAKNAAYVLRYTGTTITGGGTIAYADIDNTDNIKAGDKIIDISGAIYAIASVDITNQTVTVGASPVINLFCDAENLIPAATDTYDLGSSSYQWSNVYANEVKTTLVDPYTNTMILVRSTDNTWDKGARMFLYSNSYLSQGYGQFYLDVDHGDNNHTKTGVTLAPNSFYPQGGTVNTTYGVSLGTATAQWAKVYAEQYYYNGIAWGLDKYNQWTGVNDFNNLIGLNGAELWFKNSNIDDFTANPSVDTGKSIVQVWNKGTTQYCGGIIDGLDTSGTHIFEIVNFGYPLGSTNAYQHRFRFASKRDGTASFHPTYPNVDLGTSTNKWKTINGINPGALSLPSNSYTGSIAITEIDRTGWVYDGTVNRFRDESD